MENEPDLKWHRQMHSLLQKMIHTIKKYVEGIPPERVDTFTAEYKSILAAAADEYTLHSPAKEYMDGYNLHLKLSRYQKEHLLFLTHPEIDWTNNISERELRKFKRKQKQAVVLRSDLGGQRICDALSIEKEHNHQVMLLCVLMPFIASIYIFGLQSTLHLGQLISVRICIRI